MNKYEYIKELDEIKAPDELKEKLKELKNSKATQLKKRRHKRTAAILAAAAAMIFVFTGLIHIISDSTSNIHKKSADKVETYASEDPGSGIIEDYDSDEVESIYTGDLGYSSKAINNSSSSSAESSSSSTPDSSKSESTAERKVAKEATMSVQTKDLKEFVDIVNERVKEFDGYSEKVNIDDYSLGSAELILRIPTENLDSFIATVEKTATVRSKHISSKDITDSYTDVESRIKALETEETALLGILEKCTTIKDTMDVQDRLSQVRGELENLKSKKAKMDSKVSYSKITLSVSEEERIVQTDSSFAGRLRTRFSDSVYNLSNFFEDLVVFFLGGILYIVLFAVVAAVIVVIVRKRRKK